MTPDYSRAIEDVTSGISNWRMWIRLGWLDIRRRYRRTAIGPFWTSFNLAAMVFAMGFLWAALFNQKVGDYLPYLCASLITWNFVSTIVSEGSTVFISGQALLTTIRLSKMLLVVSMVWRNVLVFFHNLAIFVLVMVLWQVPITWNTPSFLVGLFLLSLNGLWVGILIGLIATRFRDTTQLLNGLLMIVMFCTPVMWSREILKGHELISPFIDLNPFYHAVEVVRQPLLGQSPAILSWVVMASMVVIGGSATLFVFSRFRQRVTYWL
jgi:ABC-type polysaccharide/polyol phosphate export permease